MVVWYCVPPIVFGAQERSAESKISGIVDLQSSELDFFLLFSISFWFIVFQLWKELEQKINDETNILNPRFENVNFVILVSDFF